jgi:hypothetical protein
MNNLITHLKLLEKQNKSIVQAVDGKKFVKSEQKLMKWRPKEQYNELMKESCFMEKINKINKPSAKQPKEEGRKPKL